jgi:hypothetical protein
MFIFGVLLRICTLLLVISNSNWLVLSRFGSWKCDEFTCKLEAGGLTPTYVQSKSFPFHPNHAMDLFPETIELCTRRTDPVNPPYL